MHSDPMCSHLLQFCPFTHHPDQNDKYPSLKRTALSFFGDKQGQVVNISNLGFVLYGNQDKGRVEKGLYKARSPAASARNWYYPVKQLYCIVIWISDFFVI